MPSFDEALKNPTLSKIWGCVEPSQKFTNGEWVSHPCFELACNGKLYHFYRHPELFDVYPEISAFVAEVNYNMNNEIKDSYKSQSFKLLEAREAYISSLRTGQKIKEALKNG